MNMMQMVGIMVALYVIALTAICIYRKAINTKIVNTIFLIVDLALFACWAYASYKRGWTDGFMVLENISPFIMSMMPLSIFFGPRTKNFFNCSAAFLWLGMFVALIVSPQQAYIFSNYTEASLEYSAEAACHLIASLYGVYLIVTEQVKCNLKNWGKSILFMYSVIGYGVICNYIFHNDNFGMNPYGGYSIYMIDIFGSFEATLAAYLLSVLVVLTLGVQMGYVLVRLINPIEIDGKVFPLIDHIEKLKKAAKAKAESNSEPVTEATEKAAATVEDAEKGEAVASQK